MCGDEKKGCGQAGKGGKGLSKLHESCLGDTPVPSPPCSHLGSPGTLSRIVWGWLWRQEGHYSLGQAGSSLSQASWNRNDGCAERLKEMGWKWLLSNISKAGMLGREQVARTHIWKSFMAIICHHLKPRIISIITRRYT